MGYRSDVIVTMGLKAYDEMFDNIDRGILNDLLYYGIDSNDSYIKDDRATIIFRAVKWYNNFTDVEAFESYMRKLDKIVENDSDKLENYFYKKIEIGEDGATTVDTNDWDDEFTGDLYEICDWSDGYKYGDMKSVPKPFRIDTTQKSDELVKRDLEKIKII